MGLFNQKRCWHSHMKTVSPFVLKFKTTVMDSKFVQGQRIIYFDAMGDDLDGKHYVCETPEIDAILQKVEKDVWLRFAAFGGGENEGPPGVKIEKYEGDAPAPTQKHSPPKKQSGPATSTVDPSLMAKDYSSHVVEEDYHLCLMLSTAMQERFEEEVGRPMTLLDVELAQHVFAHWAIKGFDRPLHRGQTPKEQEPVPVAVEENGENPATEEQFEAMRTLAGISVDTEPDLLNEVEERIAVGMTEAEATEFIRELALPRSA